MSEQDQAKLDLAVGCFMLAVAMWHNQFMRAAMNEHFATCLAAFSLAGIEAGDKQIAFARKTMTPIVDQPMEQWEAMVRSILTGEIEKKMEEQGT